MKNYTNEDRKMKNLDKHHSLVHFNSKEPAHFLWRSWQKIVAWSMCVVVLCAILAIWREKVWDDISPSHGFAYLGIRPGLTMRQNLIGNIVFDEDEIISARSVFDIVEDDATAEENILLAMKLYQIGNQSMLTSPASAIYSVGTVDSSLLSVTLPLYMQSIEIRNNKTAEYYRSKFQVLQPGKELDLTLQVFGAAAETAERKYYKAGNQTVSYQATNKISQNDDAILYADWTKQVEIKADRLAVASKPIPYTSAGYIGKTGANISEIVESGLRYELLSGSEDIYVPKYLDGEGREIGYEKTDQHLAYDIDDEKFQTIKHATVDYNADEGYYTVHLIADLDKNYTTVDTRWALRDSGGTNDPNADFVKIEVKFQLWDNGYFKQWEMWEDWLALRAMPPMNFEMSAIQYYFEEFTYNEEDCDLTRFDFWNVA